MISFLNGLPGALFIGLGFYNLFYTFTIKKQKLWEKPFFQSFDNISFILFSFTGLLFVTQWFFEVYQNIDPLNEYGFQARIFGPNWLSYLIQPAIYLLLSQLFWIKKWRKVMVLRFQLGLILIIGVEFLINCFFTLDRDYLQSSWSISIPDILLNCGLSIISFVGLVLILYLIKLFFNKKLKP